VSRPPEGRLPLSAHMAGRALRLPGAEALAEVPAEAAAAVPAVHRSGALADATARAALLRGAAARLRAAGDEIVTTAMAETGLPEGRLRGELERTAGQLEAFAAVVDAGDYVEAIIDTADPDAKPIPRPDVRRMLVPIGPVAVFGASNFPLAFSTAGGDTASALAAGVPVIVKGHPSHPGTSELVARELSAAVADAGLPSGTFAHLPAASLEVAQALVDAPAIKASDIAAVRLHVAPLVLDLCNQQGITKGLQGKFSVYHGAAVGLVRGQAGLDEYTDAAVNDPAVKRVRERVTAAGDRALTEDQARIEVELTDGQRHSWFVEQSLGNIHRPLSDRQLDDKFRNCAARVLPASAADDVLDRCWRIAELDDVSALVDATVPAVQRA